jgi:hypothetical protein
MALTGRPHPLWHVPIALVVSAPLAERAAAVFATATAPT